MDQDQYLTAAKEAVKFVRDDDVEPYIVWFSKTLQNWKAMLSTDAPDGLYYEVTHNGSKGETYVDTYEKRSNVALPY